MELTIKITEEDLMQAAENVVYFINYNQNLHPDSEIDEKAIAVIIKQHLENKIEDIISKPEQYLTSKEMEEVEKCFSMPYSAYIKMMERDIPYPL